MRDQEKTELGEIVGMSAKPEKCPRCGSRFINERNYGKYSEYDCEDCGYEFDPLGKEAER